MDDERGHDAHKIRKGARRRQLERGAEEFGAKPMWEELQAEMG